MLWVFLVLKEWLFKSSIKRLKWTKRALQSIIIFMFEYLSSSFEVFKTSDAFSIKIEEGYLFLSKFKKTLFEMA